MLRPFIIILLLSTAGIVSAQTTYKSYHPCSFSVNLPSDYNFSDMYPGDDNPDVCDWQVKLKDGSSILTISSTLASKFSCYGIDDCYQTAIENSELNITYKTKQKTFFVISGTDKTTNKIVYWKRVFGDQFIADLYFEYSESQKTYVEPYLGTIAKSFKAD